MPQRTNAFQELVALVQKSLAPQGAKVTTSALVNVKGMSEPREIDVLIENTVGSYRMKVAVEAKDHKRKLDIVPFESLLGKYLVDGGIKVDQLVVVTRAGFFKPVIERARLLGVKLLTLSEANDADWQQFGHPFFGIGVMPNISEINIAPSLPDSVGEGIKSDGIVLCSHGTKHGRVRDFAAKHFVSEAMRRRRKEMRDYAIAAETGEGTTGCRMQFSPNHPHSIRYEGHDYPFTTIDFTVDFKDAKPLNTEYHFSVNAAPHVCKVATRPAIPLVGEVDLRKEGRVICKCCGRDRGSLEEWAKSALKKILSQPDAVTQLNAELRKSPDGQAWLEGEHLFERPIFYSIAIYGLSGRCYLNTNSCSVSSKQARLQALWIKFS